MAASRTTVIQYVYIYPALSLTSEPSFLAHFFLKLKRVARQIKYLPKLGYSPVALCSMFASVDVIFAYLHFSSINLSGLIYQLDSWFSSTFLLRNQ